MARESGVGENEEREGIKELGKVRRQEREKSIIIAELMV
jgi:hypothetical protein